MFVDLTDDMSSDDASVAVLNRSRTVNICGVKRESTGQAVEVPKKKRPITLVMKGKEDEYDVVEVSKKSDEVVKTIEVPRKQRPITIVKKINYTHYFFTENIRMQ